MNIIKTGLLDPFWKARQEQLQQVCQTHESITITMPEDGDCYILISEGDRLISALSLYFCNDGTCECSAFTHPDYRNQGYFSAALELALDYLDSPEAAYPEAELTFAASDRCRDAAQVLKALEAEFWRSEHMMELTLDDFTPKKLTSKASDGDFIRHPADYRIPIQLPMEYNPADTITCQVLIDGQEAGICLLTAGAQVNRLYLHHLEISEDLRNRGIGKNFLDEILSCAAARGISVVSLQVSGDNIPALSLYKKAGFHICETLNYYLY